MSYIHYGLGLIAYIVRLIITTCISYLHYGLGLITYIVWRIITTFMSYMHYGLGLIAYIVWRIITMFISCIHCVSVLHDRFSEDIGQCPVVKPASKPQPRHLRKGCRSRWTQIETQDFYKAVQIVGIGRWQLIAQHLNTDRTNMQLKDKWRTIMKNEYDNLRLEYGDVGM